MTNLSCAFLVLAAVMSVLDWAAVARGMSVLEYLSKPAATAALLATAATLDVAHAAPWVWRLTALAFCIVGDVFLMLPRDAFVPGLASFAVAQAAFTASFVSGGFDIARSVVAAIVAMPVGLVLARRFVGALRRAGRDGLVAPVVAYVVVISLMAVSAVSSGSVAGTAGALIFMVSDSLIAESRFVGARAWHPVGIMATYHVALAALVLALVQ